LALAAPAVEVAATVSAGLLVSSVMAGSSWY
jgi:hypothetical protein